MTLLTRSTMATLLAALAVISVPSMPDAAAPTVSAHEPVVVFLVRHGEKADVSADAKLSAEGRERAVALAGTLRSAAIDHVHSSDYVRTRDTAAPAAAMHGLDVELYDPRDLPALVETLLGAGGRHLVVGHSNTTPALVELLGGDPLSAIDEAGEYDRLYIVTIGEGGAASSVMLRYGRPYDPRPDE